MNHDVGAAILDKRKTWFRLSVVGRKFTAPIIDIIEGGTVLFASYYPNGTFVKKH